MATDPVCGMEIDEKSAAAKLEYQGKTYYFCSSHCRDMFKKDPGKYVKDDQGPGQHHHH